jgi:hypothetical protein
MATERKESKQRTPTDILVLFINYYKTIAKLSINTLENIKKIKNEFLWEWTHKRHCSFSEKAILIVSHFFPFKSIEVSVEV